MAGSAHAPGHKAWLGALLVIVGLHMLPDAWSAARAARLRPPAVPAARAAAISACQLPAATTAAASRPARRLRYSYPTPGGVG